MAKFFTQKSVKLKNLSMFRLRKMLEKEWFRFEVNLMCVGLLINFGKKIIDGWKGIKIMEGWACQEQNVATFIVNMMYLGPLVTFVRN